MNDGNADEFAIEVAEDAAEAFAGIEDGAVAGQEREEFASGAQQRGELLSGKLLEAEGGHVGWRALRHSIADCCRDASPEQASGGSATAERAASIELAISRTVTKDTNRAGGKSRCG